MWTIVLQNANQIKAKQLIVVKQTLAQKKGSLELLLRCGFSVIYNYLVLYLKNSDSDKMLKFSSNQWWEDAAIIQCNDLGQSNRNNWQLVKKKKWIEFMKHEYLVLDCIHINEYVIHQHKNSMTERSRKARRVISNFTLPQPKEEGEKEHKDFLCDYLYHKKNEPKQKRKVKISFSKEIVISQQETLIHFH